MQSLTIETPRLMLRPLTFDDVDELVRVTNDVLVAKMMATTPYPFQFADALTLVRDFLDVAKRDAGGGFAIVKPARPSALLGVISYSLFPPRADVGFWIGVNARGKGYAKEALHALIQRLFLRNDIEYITAGAYSDNDNSINLQKDVGFTVIGISKRINRYRGKPTDHIDMVLRRADYIIN